MERKQALNLIKQMHSSFRGTLQDHQVIQEAIKTLESSVEYLEKLLTKKSKKEEKSEK